MTTDTGLVNLTNDQRNMLSKSLFYARLDAIGYADKNSDASDFSISFMALMDFLKTVGIAFDSEDFNQMCNWEPTP